MDLRLPDRTLDLTTPVVMGVLNVTPDSFSDGGRFVDLDAAVRRAAVMFGEGAAIVDVGPESTRPGARPVPAAEQIRRAVPVIEAVRAAHPAAVISIDTRSAVVARAAIGAGAEIVNDISAMRDDPDMVNAVAETGAAVILMHMRGAPADMQRGGGPDYDDVVGEVCDFLVQQRDFAVRHGIDGRRIALDPGLGFGKRYEHNLLLLRHLDRFCELALPVVVGASRKSFIGRLLSIDEPADRLCGSLACAVVAVAAGTSIIRAHDIRPTVDVVRVSFAIRRATPPVA